MDAVLDDDAATRERLQRLSDALAADFEDASVAVATRVADADKSLSSVIQLLIELVRDAESWLPADVGDRLESDLIPHVVQLVLAKTAALDTDTVATVGEFLDLVMERAASRLLYCDACLLPSLERILDDQRAFYNSGSHDNSECEDSEFVGANARVSALYRRQLSRWGELGGFTLFLRCLQASGLIDANDTDEDPPNETLFDVDEIQYVYRVLYAVHDHLAQAFLSQYVGPLAQSSRVYVANMTDTAFASPTKDTLMELVQIVELIVGSVASVPIEDEETRAAIEEAGVCATLLRMDVLLWFFKSPSLEKRIYGIVEMVGVLNYATPTNQAYLAQWVMDHDLRGLLLGESKHSELIKRCGPVLRFVWTVDADTDPWMDALWTCFAGGDEAKTHEVIRSTVHSLLLDVVTFADANSLDRLLDLVQSSRRQLDTDQLALVVAVAKHRSRYRGNILRFLWGALMNATMPIDDVVVDEAIDEIVSLLGDTDEGDSALFHVLVGGCLSSIEVSTAESNASASLRLLAKLGGSTHTEGKHVDESVASRLVSAILQSFTTIKNAKTTDADGTNTSYLHGVRERLLALRGCLLLALSSHVQVRMLATLEVVWTLCVDQSAYVGESALFFQWIELCFRTRHAADRTDTNQPGHQRRLLDEETAEALLQDRFRSLNGDSISLSALCCFHHLFRTLNRQRGALATYSAAGEEPMDNDDEDEDTNADTTTTRQDLRTGLPLVGVGVLWHLALESTDDEVSEEAITLLARYHLDFVPLKRESETAKGIKNEFVEQCLVYLADAKASGRMSLVDRCLDCLRYFLDANAPTMSGDNLPDSGVASKARLNAFALASLDQELQSVEVYPSPMKDALVANDPSGSTVVYAGPRRPSWTFRQHHALLEAIEDTGDVEDESTDENAPSRRRTSRQNTSTSDHGGLDRRLSIDTTIVEAFRPTQLTTSPSVKARPDLQWIYGSQAPPSRGPDFVIDTLDDETEPQTVAQTLANRSEFVPTLFELAQWDNESTAKRAWGLLCQLPVSNELLQITIRLRPTRECDVEWAKLLDADCSHRLLYSMRLVEALLLDDQQTRTRDRTQQDTVKRQWRERFVRLGGAAHLVTTLDKLLQAPETNAPIPSSCVASIARILTYYATWYDRVSSTSDGGVSPFDLTLRQTTLPQFFSEPLDRLSQMMVLASKTAMTTQSADTAMSGLELLCSLVPLDPVAALDVLDRQHVGGASRWLASVLQTLQDPEIQSEGIQCLSALQTAISVHKTGGWALLQRLLESSISLVLDTGCDPLINQIVVLIENLAPVLVSATELVQWILDAPVASTMLSSIQHSVTSGDQHCTLCSELRVLTALATNAPAIRQQILAYSPASSAYSDTPWSIDLLTNQLLWPRLDTDANHKLSHSEKTRKAAYDAVLCLAFNASPQIATVLERLGVYHTSVSARLSAMGRPWNFQPTDELRPVDTDSFAGLVNPGCVCYMNSLLQQLFAMSVFRDGLLTIDANSSSDHAWYDEVLELQKLFVSLAVSDRRALDPTAFALAHKDLDGNPTDLNLQMDADEFFCLLLDRIETFVGANKETAPPANPPTPTFLDDCFGGVLVNQVLTEHGHLSERHEKFFALSLEVAQKQQLTASLALYVQGETLDGDNAYFCKHANQKVRATRRACIKRLPQTLVCHLKRFEFDFDTMEKTKIHDYLSFPLELDMFPYTADAFVGETPTPTPTSTSTRQELYDLVGVVVHAGTSDMGHYYSFIRDPSTDQWTEFNDQTVRPFDAATLGDECFGGDQVTQKWDVIARAYKPVVQPKRRSAYMLIYNQRSETSTSIQPPRTQTVDWSVVPASVQRLRNAVEDDNEELRRLVDAATAQHCAFLCEALDKAIVACAASPETDEDGVDVSVDASAAVAACRHVLDLIVLLSPSDLDADAAKVLDRVDVWLSERAPPHQRASFAKWLLGQSSTASTLASHNDSSVQNLAHRSWLFDLLLFCDKKPDLVQRCFILLERSLRCLVDHNTQDPVAGGFVWTLVTLFFDRDEIALEDPATGSHFPVPQTSMIHAVTLVGSLLKSCASDQSLRPLLLSHSGFLDRLLFSLQSPGTGIVTLTSRVRSCTLAMERHLVSELLADPLPATVLLEDPRLLLQQPVLKHMVTHQLDEPLLPLVVHTVSHVFTRSQSDKLVAALLAVMEDTKLSALEPMLRLFGALLDAEDAAEKEGTPWPPRLHRAILSPTSGLLEAAAYYRDHRTLHEYAFLLVEFVVTRASASARLQWYLQHDGGVREQVAWVNDWLGSTLDPDRAIRNGRTVDSDQEAAVLDDEVRSVFRSAEQAFGFKILSVGSSGEEDVVEEESDGPPHDAFAVDLLEDSNVSSEEENMGEKETKRRGENQQQREVTDKVSARGELPRRRDLSSKYDHATPELDDEDDERADTRRQSPTATYAISHHMSSAA